MAVRVRGVRTAAFNPVETNVLLSCIKKYKNIIENKKTDAVTIFEKRKAWELVTQEFNSSHNVIKRDEIQLKKYWERQKSLARKTGAPDVWNIVSSQDQIDKKTDDEEILPKLPAFDPALCDEVPAPDSDYHWSSESNPGINPLDAVRSIMASEYCSSGSCEPADVPTSEHEPSTSATSKADLQDDPATALLEQSPRRASRQVKIPKASHRTEEEQERDLELHELRLAQHAELHATQLQNEADVMEHRNRLARERHALGVQQDTELHRMKVRHLQEMYSSEIKHQRAISAAKLRRAELELSWAELRLQE